MREGRTSQEVRELKCDRQWRWPPAAGRTSQEVRELKYDRFADVVDAGLSHLARGA